MVHGLGLRVVGLGFRVYDSGFRVQGILCRVQGSAAKRLDSEELVSTEASLGLTDFSQVDMLDVPYNSVNLWAGVRRLRGVELAEDSFF